MIPSEKANPLASTMHPTPMGAVTVAGGRYVLQAALPIVTSSIVHPCFFSASSASLRVARPAARCAAVRGPRMMLSVTDAGPRTQLQTETISPLYGPSLTVMSESPDLVSFCRSVPSSSAVVSSEHALYVLAA